MNYQKIATEPNTYPTNTTDMADQQVPSNQVFYQQPLGGLMYFNPAMQAPYVGYPVHNQMPQMNMQSNAMPINIQVPQSADPQSSVPKSRFNENLYCKNCKRTVPSQVRYEKGKGTYLAGTIILLFGCWAGCCLVPCCAEDCLDANHYCSSCGMEIGSKKFLFEGK